MPKSNDTPEAPRKVFRIKVTLLGLTPAIWRRIEVDADTRLDVFHAILQAAMGWERAHLHMFRKGKQLFGEPGGEAPLFGPPVQDESKVLLSDVLTRARSKMIYDYDFGDSWEHEVRVEKTLEPEPGKLYPVCTAGKNACPPEDSGGVIGYADLLDALENGDDADDDARLEWLGSDFDPTAFDMEEANQRMQNLWQPEAFGPVEIFGSPVTREGLRELLRNMAHDDPVQITGALEAIGLSAEGPGGDLAWLAAYDLDRGVAEGAAVLLFNAFQGDFVPEKTQETFDKSARRALRQALEDKNVPDERKVPLAPLLKMAGGAITPGQMETFFDDFQAVSDRLRDQIADTITDTPQSLEETLETFGVLTGEDEPPQEEALFAAVAAAADLLPKAPRAGVGIFCAATAMAAECGHSLEPYADLLEPLSEHLATSNAWPLARLADWPGAEPLREPIRSTLAQRGIGPDTRLPLLLERPFAHGLVTAVDGQGSRSLALFFRTPEGELDAVNLLLNDEQGIRDLWTVYEEGAEAAEQFRAQRLPLVSCDLDLARALLADAMARHLQNGGVLPGRLFLARPYFGEAPLAPQLRTPNLGAYMLETITPAPALAEESEALAEDSPFGDLWFASDAAYDFVRAHKPRRASARKLGKKAFEAFVREIAPVEMETLLARMAQNLELEAWAGRAKQPPNQLAAKTWLVLSAQACPPGDVPYVRALARHGIECILENLAQGYESQAEANAAGLEHDEALGELFAYASESLGFDPRKLLRGGPLE